MLFCTESSSIKPLMSTWAVLDCAESSELCALQKYCPMSDFCTATSRRILRTEATDSRVVVTLSLTDWPLCIHVIANWLSSSGSVTATHSRVTSVDMLTVIERGCVGITVRSKQQSDSCTLFGHERSFIIGTFIKKNPLVQKPHNCMFCQTEKNAF